MAILQRLHDTLMGPASSERAPSQPDVASAAAASNAAQQEALQAASSADTVYVAKPKDTLSEIARRATGDYTQYRALNVHNGRDPEDASLDVGQSLRIPAGWDHAALGITPAPIETPTLDAASDHAPAAESNADESWWDVDPYALASSTAQTAVQVADHASRQVSNRLGQALSDGYSRFFRKAGAETGPEAAQGEEVAEEIVQAGPPENVHADGFDEGMAQAHIDAMIEAYMGIEVGGVQAKTQYRNTHSAKAGGGFKDPVWNRLGEAEMYKNYPSLYFAVMGKASPQQMKEAIQIAIDAGAIHKNARKSPEDQLTAEDIDKWSKTNLGVDCIGLVMNMLLTTEDFGDFVPPNTNGSDFQRYMSVNCRHFEAASQAVEDPDQWRALDVITWTGGVGSGHVILIRAVSRGEDGTYALDCVESAGSQGPKRSRYTYHPSTGFGGSIIPKEATVRRAQVAETAPVAEALEA